MWPYFAPKPLRGGASKGSGAWVAHVKGAKDGKEEWLLEIRIGNRANDAGRVSGGHRVGGDIFSYDGASANDDSVTQGDALENHGTRPNETAATNLYGLGVCRTL